MTDRQRCQGTSRQTGKPCKKWAEEGRNYCKFHGGRTPTGQNHWNYKHGRYAKSAPQRYLRAIGAALQDPNLTSLRESIALVDARLVEELEGLDETASAETWKKLSELCPKLESAARESEDQDLASVAFKAVNLIRKGAEQESKWGDLLDTIERRARLSDRERTRERELKAYMTADQVVEFTTMLTQVVAELLQDRRSFQIFLDRVANMPAIAKLPAGTVKTHVLDAEIVETRPDGG